METLPKATSLTKIEEPEAVRLSYIKNGEIIESELLFLSEEQEEAQEVFRAYHDIITRLNRLIPSLIEFRKRSSAVVQVSQDGK